MTALTPGATIGILGTGQLGRMLATAAAKLGFRVVTFGPENDPPAARVADDHVVGAYEDEAALKTFAERIDVATYEFENIPATTVTTLIGMGVPVRPDEKVLAVCQDRLAEKKFLQSEGFATAPFVKIDQARDLETALEQVGGQGILKTRRFGYDGKGQVRIKTGDDQDAAFQACGTTSSILEGLVDFEMEISQVAARSLEGQFAFYDLPKNTHRDGILRTSEIPAPNATEMRELVQQRTAHLLETLNYVGVLTIEFFVSAKDGLVANEIAPRVHNSGHWTVEACLTSQFEQHIRAVAGWPLGDPYRHSDATMINLIGEDAAEWDSYARKDQTAVTLYGKKDMRAGRKMGHVVSIGPRK